MSRRLSTPSTSVSQAAGFTLIEVMIALAILAGSLVIFLHSTAGNVYSTRRAELRTAATNLARDKMYDLEEFLLEEGFQELDKSEEGNFADNGWPELEWKYEIKKPKLPNIGAMQALAQASQAGGEGAEGGQAGAESNPATSGGLLGGMMSGGLDPTAAGDSAFLASQFETLRNVLEQSVRKVTLTITWSLPTDDEELLVEAYFTDPKAVNRILSLVGGGEEGGDSGGSPEAGDNSAGTGTPKTPSPSRPSPRVPSSREGGKQ